MPDEKVCYREIPVYKYKLAEDYQHQTALTEGPQAIGDWVVLDADGGLKLKQGYAWDGPSGPSFDTPSFMCGSPPREPSGRGPIRRWCARRREIDLKDALRA